MIKEIKNLFQKKQEDPAPEAVDYSVIIKDYEAEYKAYDKLVPVFTDWVENQSSIVLAETYDRVNGWEWPDYLPPCPFDHKAYVSDIKNLPAWQFKFVDAFMDLCESRAEALFPGIVKAVRYKRIYRDMQRSQD